MLSVTILGNNSAIPAYDRHPTAQAVQNEDQIFLIDCGEGTQMQMSRFKIKTSRISNIFISHLHGDHYFGLIGLLTSMALLGRKNTVNLYAPAPLQSIIDIQLQVAGAILPYPLNFIPLEGESVLFEDKRIVIESFHVYHRISCWGFKFQEKHGRKIDPEKVKEHQVPTSFFESLHQGLDYQLPDNTYVSNRLLTLDPPASKVYAFCGDTLFNETIADKVKGVDLLYHEATYLHNLQEKAYSRFHSTSKEAAMIAKKAGAAKLLLGHFSSQYESLDPFLQEAKEIFENTELATEGATFLI